ncbi:hypothetical protein [Streptomyces sp. NBC_01262]|uniref:hypothetical protein n=1 Tax=Streptomyces sp. NBC_01262 TaxID=2903803 RepID=UPI002E346F7B|nr:hypothetical protein [Streptomyces sp. NBC_01262]
MLTSTVCVALSAAGLAIALLTAYRKRYLAAVRTAAFALLPVGLYMTGLVTLGSKVGKAIGSWASDLVFKPSVWAGFAVLAVSAVLYAGSRFAAGRRKEKGKGGGQGRAAVAPASTAPALPKSKRAQATSDLSDFSDVEEILKRRGI